MNMNDSSRFIIINTILKTVENRIKKNTEEDDFFIYEIYEQIKKHLKVVLIKLRFNKKLVMEVGKLFMRIMMILKNNSLELQNFELSTLVSSIMFIIMKEKLKIKFGVVFEMNTDIDLHELNECLNYFYINLKKQSQTHN